jgi:phosphoglycolate phosphatase-like HAD superfamily hydrolase
MRVLPGARELVDALRDRADVCVGLLTGNVREGAELKLGAVDLWQKFRLGAYGDDHWDRYRLPAIAVARAREELGIDFVGQQVVIIGDTIHDVRCGQSIGVRTIAVGTGFGIDEGELLASNPDYFFKDLSDWRLAVDAILEEV